MIDLLNLTGAQRQVYRCLCDTPHTPAELKTVLPGRVPVATVRDLLGQLRAMGYATTAVSAKHPGIVAWITAPDVQEGTEMGRRRPTAQGVLWVCVACYLARDTGERGREACGCNPACVPWSLEPDTDATVGLDCGIPDHWETDSDSHSTGCETREMSRNRCDGCGCTLDGSRHAYTWWA